MKHEIDTITLQIGVLMAAVSVIATKLGTQDQALVDSMHKAMQNVIDTMLAKGVTDLSLEHAQGTMNAILAGLSVSAPQDRARRR